MAKFFSEKKARKALEDGFSKAKEILNDNEKIEELLQQLEDKLQKVPVVGGKLSCLPIMISLLRDYVKGEYLDLPLKSLLALTSALIYFVSPIDLIPDTIPGLGFLDDIAVILHCWKCIEGDVVRYIAWRDVFKNKPAPKEASIIDTEDKENDK